jgi:CheY-like chemotaxis protein
MKSLLNIQKVQNSVAQTFYLLHSNMRTVGLSHESVVFADDTFANGSNDQILFEIRIVDSSAEIPEEEYAILTTPLKHDEDIHLNVGLGLHMTKILVARMNGHITMQRNHGHGATIIVTIPMMIAPKPAGSAELMKKKKTAGFQYRILCCTTLEFSNSLKENLSGEFIRINRFDEHGGVVDKVLSRRLDAVVLDKNIDAHGTNFAKLAPLLGSNTKIFVVEQGQPAITHKEEFPVSNLRLVSTPAEIIPLLKSDLNQKLQSIKHSTGILIADDDDFNLRIITTFVKHDGYKHVYTAKNCEEAFLIYQQESRKINVILMDNEMPLCDGPTCTKKIMNWMQERGIQTNVRIIGITGNVSEAKLKLCRESGMHPVLKKPVSMGDLSEVILQQLFQD